MSKYMNVYPEKGAEPFVARALLDMADNPNDVQVLSTPPAGQRLSGSVGFRVPVELFERFEKAMNTPLKDGEPVVETVTVADAEEDKPVKRKPGRPKKVEDQ